MPYCENCPYFEPETDGNIYYAGGSPYCYDHITIYCEKRDICKRVERQIKGE